jgi:hypothetical protein
LGGADAYLNHSSGTQHWGAAFWKKTLEDEDTQQRLAANVFRRIVLGLADEHPATK